MAATGELKETLVNFLWEDCYYAITEGEKILPRQRNWTVDESARLMWQESDKKAGGHKSDKMKMPNLIK